MKGKWPLLLILLSLLLGGIAAGRIFLTMENTSVNIAAINQIGKQAAKDWEQSDFTIPEDCPYDYAVIDNTGRILFQTTDEIPLTVFDTIKTRGAVLDITVKQTVVGKALISTGYEENFRKEKKQLASAAILTALLLMAVTGMYTLFLNQRMIRPFLELKGFAKHVALGDLDFPLPMDRHHVFGAFTESFDIMREQLKEARQKEAAANQSKKELVASLSHDIRTPVSSIKLISELLMVTEKNKQTLEKVETIYKKSEQIDHLITNMLHASLEDLGQLQVHVREETSQVLTEAILNADYDKKSEILPIPGCILLMDPFRMEQVVGNIINNAYKYAGTAITVCSELTEDGLRLEFKDYGEGVPNEELTFLFQKYYRGSSHLGQADGSGLGLYISRYLMEKMGGMIDCYNRVDGFSVVLLFPLANHKILLSAPLP